jgi:hypothetical protein
LQNDLITKKSLKTQGFQAFPNWCLGPDSNRHGV